MTNFKSLSQASEPQCSQLKAFLCILLAALVAAAPAGAVDSIDDPSLVTHMDAKVVQSGSVSVLGSAAEWIKLNITIPQNTEYQKAIDKLDKVYDEFANTLWAQKIDNPPSIVSYSGESAIEVSARKTASLPASYTVPESVKRYMLPTRSIQSKDTKIANLAKNITNGKDTDFEKIAALAIYVHHNVNYTKSLGSSAKDAIWVLENKVGTCDEYSTLFIALARSLGYPTRYVSGYAYGDDGWVTHAWAEVYLGKWVPVDPTWLEVGWLDATHIIFHVSDDNIIENSAQAYGIGTKTVNWLSDDAAKIEIISAGTRDKIMEYTITQTAERISAEEKTFVVLRMTPHEYAVLDASLEPCRASVPVASVSNKKQEAVLMPGAEKIIFWEVTAGTNLPEGMIYTCPLVLNSRLLGEKRIDVVVDTSGEESYADVFADVKSPALVLGERETVFAGAERIKGSGAYKIGIITPEYYGETTLTTDAGTADFSFTPASVGDYKAVIFSSTGQAKEAEYTVKPSADTRITDVTIPRLVKSGENATITVHVKSAGHVEKDMRLASKIDGTDMLVSNFKIRNSANITLDYAADSIGEKTVRFELSGPGDASDYRTEKFRVYDVPVMDATLTEDFGKNAAVIQLEPSKDYAENVSVLFLGAEKYVGQVTEKKSVEFGITSFGKSEAVVLFYDAAGNVHSAKFYLDVKKEGLFHRILRSLLSFLGK